MNEPQNQTTAIATVDNAMMAQPHHSTEIELMAETFPEMRQCQVNLISWAQNKINEVQAEYNDLDESYKHAKAKAWKSSTLLRHRDLAGKRVEYYRKMLAAFEQGYILVPNFPVELFAIRTGAKFPKEMASFRNWDTRRQSAQQLPLGEGQYKNPIPLVGSENVQVVENQQTMVKKEYTAVAFDQIDFPMTMAKPAIMQAVDRAMALKVFDQFGILPGVKRNIDPIIVGQLIDPRGSKYNRKLTTFMISWFLDTRTL